MQWMNNVRKDYWCRKQLQELGAILWGKYHGDSGTSEFHWTSWIKYFPIGNSNKQEGSYSLLYSLCVSSFVVFVWEVECIINYLIVDVSLIYLISNNIFDQTSQIKK